MYNPTNDTLSRQQQMQQMYQQMQQQPVNPQDLPENQLPAPLPLQSGTGMPQQMAELALRQRQMQGSGRVKPVRVQGTPMQDDFNQE